MAHKYNISEAGLELIKAFEGFRPVETVLVSGQKVIGYGHPYVRGEAALLTQRRAEDILKSDLEPIEKIINHIVFAPLSQNQFDALVSLAFNIGVDAFEDSTVLHYLNNGQPLAAAAGFDEWRKSIIADQTYVIDALVRRRTAEKALFLSAASGFVTAPRYEVPVIHDSSVRSAEDDIEVFINDDTDGFVEQAPYEEHSNLEQTNPAEDITPSAIMLSERVAAPVLYDDTPETNFVDDSVSEDVSIEEPATVDNVVEIKPAPELEEETSLDIETEVEVESVADIVSEKDIDSVGEIETETEVETEIELEVEPESAQHEDLSPIALAAADVSERLDNLMDETEVEALAEVEKPTEDINMTEVPDLISSEVDEIVEVTTTDDDVVEFEPAEPEVVEFDVEEIKLVKSGSLDTEVIDVETTGSEVPTNDALEPEFLEPEFQETALEEVEIQESKDNAQKIATPTPNITQGKKRRGSAYGTALIVGLLLIVGGLWKLKFAPAIQLGRFGDASDFLAPVVLLVGAMMILGGMYYMLKSQLRRDA